MGTSTLTISSKNYSSWSLRGWLITKLSGISFEEKQLSPDDPEVKAEILLLSSSILTPKLEHEGLTIWDTIAIGETLNEMYPEAKLLPTDLAARAHCRAICGEMHSGFASLRSSLPMNVKGDFPNFKIWSRALDDIARITSIWEECLEKYKGPFLFGDSPCIADAMYAPVVCRFISYHVELSPRCEAFCETIIAMPEMQEWIEAAKIEPDAMDELEMEF